MSHGLKTVITFWELGRWSISCPGIHNLGFVLTGALFCTTIPAQTHIQCSIQAPGLFHYSPSYQHYSQPEGFIKVHRDKHVYIMERNIIQKCERHNVWQSLQHYCYTITWQSEMHKIRKVAYVGSS